MVTIHVDLDIAKKIKTVDDLNLFYAVCEDSYIGEGDDYQYSFPKEVQDHIDELTENIDYSGGMFDMDKAKEFFGDKFDHYFDIVDYYIQDFNEQFWSLVDEYESGEITKKQLYDKLLSLNGGDEEETKADMELAKMGQHFE